MSNELVASQVTDEHIEFVITCLAHFYTTDEVLDRFAREFGKHIDRKTCNKLNPQLKSSRNLDSKWVFVPRGTSGLRGTGTTHPYR